MSTETIGIGIQTRLKTISALKRVYAPNELPDSPNAFPCALILQGETKYDADFSDSYDITFRVIILITKQNLPTALNRIIDFTENTGSSSVRAAINGDNTLDSTADDSQVVSNTGMGSTTWGRQVYVSTEFEIRVWA